MPSTITVGLSVVYALCRENLCYFHNVYFLYAVMCTWRITAEQEARHCASAGGAVRRARCIHGRGGRPSFSRPERRPHAGGPCRLRGAPGHRRLPDVCRCHGAHACCPVVLSDGRCRGRVIPRRTARRRGCDQRRGQQQTLMVECASTHMPWRPACLDTTRRVPMYTLHSAAAHILQRVYPLQMTLLDTNIKLTHCTRQRYTRLQGWNTGRQPRSHPDLSAHAAARGQRRRLGRHCAHPQNRLARARHTRARADSGSGRRSAAPPPMPRATAVRRRPPGLSQHPRRRQPRARCPPPAPGATTPTHRPVHRPPPRVQPPHRCWVVRGARRGRAGHGPCAMRGRRRGPQGGGCGAPCQSVLQCRSTVGGAA
eukprot:m.720576 g.720576  ORF g.720576 m.720576 type:complete len:369 (-) comp23006_c0_seq5:1508-2614(-)